MTGLADYIESYAQLKQSQITVRNNINTLKADIYTLLNTYFNNINYSLEYITSESVIIYVEVFDNSLISVFESLNEDNINYVVDTAEKYDETVFSIELTPDTS